MQIKNKDGSVIFSDDSATLKQTIENAVKTKVSLSKADLRGVSLYGANLSGADLRGADLTEANLYGANLSGADLTEANLYGANLTGADLTGAYLSWANLSKAYLTEADLSKAYLTEANLSGADLTEADLRGAGLSEADLRGADLTEAYLYGAYLSGADLSKANLRRANLSGANLSETDLSGANLSETDLSGANLFGANLTGTCLDPTAQLPSLDLGGDEKAFAANTKATENDPEFLYGWRTAKSAHCTTNGVYVTYEPGCEYVAPWFSVADTECHPGLYLAPSIEWLENNDYEGPFVMVKALKSETIKAGEKYRCKRFWVL